MESQLPRAHGHHYEHERPHIQTAVGEGHEDEHHHEKKSVIGKVKEKAKKIKNTLKKHGHGHDHDPQHYSHDDDDEDYGEDEEMVTDPEIHGAPIYDSATVTAPQASRAAGLNSGLPKGNLEKPSVPKEDRYESIIEEPAVRTFAQWEEEENSRGRPEDKHVSFSSGVHNLQNNPIRSGGGWGENFTGTSVNESNTGLVGNVQGRGSEFSESVGNVGRRGGGGNMGQQGVGIGGPIDMDEDTNAPGKSRIFVAPSNYQTKVADTGTGEEAGITPILHSLDKMGIYDKPQQKPNKETMQNLSATGSHDQFFPEPMPTNASTTGAAHELVENKSSGSEIPTVVPHHTSENPSSSSKHSGSYTEMISSAASSVANKAALAKNMVASTIGYGGPETGTPTGDSSAQRGGPTEYVHKFASTVTEKLAPVHGKVVGGGSANLGQGDKGGGVSVKEYWMEKLKPGDEDKALSEVISGAFSTHKGKEEGSRGAREMVSDAVHKRAPEEEKHERDEERKPIVMGRVTESKDVAERLGIEGEKDGGAGVGVGKGMVDMIRGTVSSWMGKENHQQQTSPVTAGGEAAHGRGEEDKDGHAETKRRE